MPYGGYLVYQGRLKLLPTVLTADLACDNGVVHVIDRVILPG